MLNDTQKAKLQSIRSNWKQIPVALWTISKTGVNANDAYGRASSITSGSSFFSGSIAWGSTIMRVDSPGGYYKTSDVSIVVSLDEKDKLDSENNYLICEGVKLRMKDFAQATDTNELVVHCERLND